MAETLPKWFRILIALAVSAGIFFFLSSVGSLVKLFIIAAILAYILNPVVNYLESLGLNRHLATTIIFLCVISILSLFIFLLLPLISSELQSLHNSFSTDKTTEIISSIEENIEGKIAFLGVENLNVMNRLRTFVSQIGGKLFGYLLDAVSLIKNMIIIPFFMFFLLKDGRSFNKRLIAIIPNRYFEIFINLIHKTDVQLGNYMRGQIIESLIVGVLAMASLAILNVKYALLIGLFVGLSNLIPYLGPLIGAALAVIVAIFDTGDLDMAMYVAVALLLVQLIDNMIIKPIVVAKAVDMHPMVVLLVVLVGGKLFGILGMLLSVPFTAIVLLVLKEVIFVFRRPGIAQI